MDIVKELKEIKDQFEAEGWDSNKISPVLYASAIIGSRLDNITEEVKALSVVTAEIDSSIDRLHEELSDIRGYIDDIKDHTSDLVFVLQHK